MEGCLRMFNARRFLLDWVWTGFAAGRRTVIMSLLLLTPALAVGASQDKPQQPATAGSTPVSSVASPQLDKTPPNLHSEEKGLTGTAPGQGSANPAVAQENSLKQLSALYERELERLTRQHKQSQELYNDGLIARVELEASAKSVSAVQAKLEEVRKQISEAEKRSGGSQPLVDLADLSNPNNIAHGWWTTGSSKVDNLIKLNAGLFGVDPFLVYCLMSQESSFNPGAVSPKGARGLMQLMPTTAARYGVTNPYDAAQSIRAGTHYLKDLLDLFNGRIDLALAGYNAGENAVIKYGYQIPPYAETRSYVRLISKRYAKKPSTPVTSKT